MPQKKLLSIPLELQEIKAFELYQQRLAEGRNANSEEDWDRAGEYFINYPLGILAWKWNRKFRKFWQPLQSFLNVCCKIVTFPFWLLWKLPILFSQSDTRDFALDVVKTLVTAFGLIATFIAGVGLIINYWSSEKNIQLTQERLITERFSKALEQLGSDKEESILGGIYSLDQISKDSPKNQWIIMQVLASFVRKNSPQSIGKYEPRFVKVRVQAALTVIGERNPKYDLAQKNFDLSQSDLVGGNLYRSHLVGAKLIGTDLSQTNLVEVNLKEANLVGAKLIGANLRKVNLVGANLSEANLSEANLKKANLKVARNLSLQQIKTACNWELAIYAPGELEYAEKDKASNPKVKPDCSRWHFGRSL